MDLSVIGREGERESTNLRGGGRDGGQAGGREVGCGGGMEGREGGGKDVVAPPPSAVGDTVWLKEEDKGKNQVGLQATFNGTFRDIVMTWASSSSFVLVMSLSVPGGVSTCEKNKA